MVGRLSSRIWVGWLAAIAAALVLTASQARSQDYVPLSQSLELPRGVKVDVPPHVQGEALAELLENYARQLRANETPAPAFTNAALAAQPVRLSSSQTNSADKVAAEKIEAPAAEAAEHADAVVEQGMHLTWGERRATFLPATLLWQPPLANPHEPRFYAKSTNLQTWEFDNVVDFSIGGTLALWRLSPVERPHDGVQIDIFATTLSRFINNDAMAAIDYRAGLPFTFALGPWSAKLSYEHTSTHLGDEFLLATKTPFRSAVRDELAAGLAYRVLEPLRVYGTLGYAVSLGSWVEDADPMRYTLGAEWSRPLPTGVCGQPFAALDVEFRGNEDFTPNVTAQLGWQWLGYHGRPGLRVALEYYDGRSPFGQLSDRHESWVGFGLFFDY